MPNSSERRGAREFGEPGEWSSKRGLPTTPLGVDQALAMEVVRERQRVFETREEPEARWQQVAGFLGLPVLIDEQGQRVRPWLTATLIAACCAVSISMWKDDWGPGGAAESLGIVGGVGVVEFLERAILSSLAHASVPHLLVDAYFLWVFGSVVEATLGKLRCALLLFTAAVLSAVVHVLATSHPEVPVIGARGAISGAIAWYALKFPRNRIALLLAPALVSRTWLDLPAPRVLAIWLAFQIAAFALFGSTPALTTSLGGVLAGALFWLATRKSPRGDVLTPALRRAN